MPVRAVPHRDRPVVEDRPVSGWRQGSPDLGDRRISSTELAYPCRQLREVYAWRVGRYMTDGVLHRTFSRQTDEMAGVVQPLAIGEIFGVGEVSPGRVFEGLHQAVSLHGNEPSIGAAVDFTHNVADDAARRGHDQVEVRLPKRRT